MSDPIALLVDGDNISNVQAAEIAKIAAQHGELRHRRAYLDVKCGGDWWNAGPFRVMHSGSGKNAADILLALDAQELFYEKGIRRFLIATSDGDFRHLVLRLREAGAWVFGIGESKTPQALRDSLDGFYELQAKQAVVAITPQALGPKPIGVSNVVSLSGAIPPASNTSKVDQKIRNLIAKHSKAGGGYSLDQLSRDMKAEHEITITSLGAANWRAYFSVRTHLFDLDPKGPNAKIRFRPKGFRSIA
jgi:hypothetical protein